MADAPRYRFGPLEKRGVLAGLRGPQVALAFGVVVIALFALRSLPAGMGLLTAVAVVLLGGTIAFVPVVGRTTDEWAPIIAGWLGRTASRRRRFVSAIAIAGGRRALDAQPQFPFCLADVILLSHVVPGSGARMGVAKDQRLGTYTAVLSVRGKSFALLDGSEKARRLGSWGDLLAGLAREGGLIHRVQWIERTVPDPGDEIGEYLKHNIAVSLDSPLARSYLEVVDEAGPVTQEHEVFVALQVSAARCARAIKAAGGGDDGACEVLRRELTSLSSSLMSTEVVVEGALTPRLLAHALRTSFDPGSRSRLASIGSRQPERVGTSQANAGPMATEENWSTFHSDGAWHASYWIAEWPRVDTDPDFLAPLLLRTEAMRTVAVTMEPVSPLKAIRSVEAARTSAAADEELRQRAGFVTTTRRQREHDSLADHERDLSDGHAFYRFAGFITVTAATRDELTISCGEIEESAGRSFLDIRRLNGEQAHAFTYTLPLCRGLK